MQVGALIATCAFKTHFDLYYSQRVVFKCLYTPGITHGHRFCRMSSAPHLTQRVPHDMLYGTCLNPNRLALVRVLLSPLSNRTRGGRLPNVYHIVCKVCFEVSFDAFATNNVVAQHSISKVRLHTMRPNVSFTQCGVK